MIHFRDKQSQWIWDALTPVAEGDAQRIGIPVSSVVPAVYGMYVKLLHSIEANFTYLNNPLTSSEEVLLGFSDCEPIRSLVSTSRSRLTQRLRWSEIASALCLPYTAELNIEWCRKRLQPGCWPRYISGPNEGVLLPEEASRLIEVLSPHTMEEPITCRLADMSVPNIGTPVVHEGSLQTVLDLIRQPEYANVPEYWWPKNRSWCVVSDYDLDFTLIGGPHDLCAALLDDSYLECMEVVPSTRIDCFIPLPTS